MTGALPARLVFNSIIESLQGEIDGSEEVPGG
jgi:hypothetical protein